MTTDDLLEDAHLRYSTDSRSGFTRKINGDSYQYFDLNGKRITEDDVIERINKLSIPPAYTRVWICPYANGHLQAVGYDAKKRKQYRYHPQWIHFSQQEKFSRLSEFAQQLPRIREKIRKDLSLEGMPRQKVVAAVVWLLENTLIRIGNEEYEKENKSYGLTTLKNKHASVFGENKIVFQFKGKSGIYHKVSFRNKRVARIVRKCKEIPGQDLFEYFDGQQEIQSITSQDVNTYLQEISGSEITAKDFRTWGGTLLAAHAFDKNGVCTVETESKKNIVDTVKHVAGFLRNKPNTCKKYYIHPMIIAAYTKGFILSNIHTVVKSVASQLIDGLDIQENNLLLLLNYMKKTTKQERGNVIYTSY